MLCYNCETEFKDGQPVYQVDHGPYIHANHVDCIDALRSKNRQLAERIAVETKQQAAEIASLKEQRHRLAGRARKCLSEWRKSQAELSKAEMAIEEQKETIESNRKTIAELNKSKEYFKSEYNRLRLTLYKISRSKFSNPHQAAKEALWKENTNG